METNEQATEATRYENWKWRVNNAIVKTTGLGADDIDDWDYYSAFQDGMKPETAARKALRAAGWPG
jgi:hypothetical protein